MIKNFLRFAPTTCVFLCAIACPIEAAQLPRYGVFVYSSECLEKESDDAAGNRVLLIRDGNGDTLYWYWPDGPMEGPVQAHPLSIDDKSSKIVFSVDIGSQDSFDRAGHFVNREKPDIETYSGTISDKFITLNGNNLGLENWATIPRVTNFVTKIRQCK